jgi:acetyl-CoA carboxylase biotin carboxyl carrier protein
MAKKAGKDGVDGALGKLKTLYEFMTRNGLETLEIDEPEWRVKLARRNASAAPVPVPMMAAGPMQSALAAAPAMMSQAAQAPAVPAGGQTIKASMMGIFYRASSPSSPPFVKEGDTVKAGHVLCMIEAMKVFNEIKAEFPCVVLKVLVENGKPVKSGQDLFIIQRA